MSTNRYFIKNISFKVFYKTGKLIEKEGWSKLDKNYVGRNWTNDCTVVYPVPTNGLDKV